MNEEIHLNFGLNSSLHLSSRVQPPQQTPTTITILPMPSQPPFVHPSPMPFHPPMSDVGHQMPMTPIPMVRLVPSQAGASMGIAPSGVPMAPMGGTMPSVMYSTAQNVTASGVELEIQGTTVAVGTLRNKSPRDMSVSTGRSPTPVPRRESGSHQQFAERVQLIRHHPSLIERRTRLRQFLLFNLKLKKLVRGPRPSHLRDRGETTFKEDI